MVQTLWRLKLGSDANLALCLGYVAQKLIENGVEKNKLEISDSECRFLHRRMVWGVQKGTRRAGTKMT
jgi:hypothetical protein